MKKIWKQNRVLFMLIIILILCFIAIITVSLTFFYSKNTSKYGSRLDDIEKYPITNEFKEEVENNLLENESITKVSINVIGRVIYINVTLDEKIKLEKAEEIMTDSLDLFTDEIKGYYDIEYVLKSENFTIIGAKNPLVDHIVWNNNREVIEEENSDEE